MKCGAIMVAWDKSQVLNQVTKTPNYILSVLKLKCITTIFFIIKISQRNKTSLFIKPYSAPFFSYRIYI